MAYLQIFVRCIALQPYHTAAGVIKPDASLVKKCLDFIKFETLGCFNAEMVAVSVEYMAHYAPHVVNPVWIEKLHRPALRLWRERAQHQQFGIVGYEWFKRVAFNNLFHKNKVLYARQNY